LKTVEIIVEEKAAGPVVRFRDDDLVKLIVAFTEKGLRDRLKAEGGRWTLRKSSGWCGMVQFAVLSWKIEFWLIDAK
jgi:hypothetical protein